MIRSHLHIPGLDWTCHVYYIVTRPDADEILKHLVYIGCGDRDMRRAYHNLTSGKLNSGLTYSNSSLRESVVVIAKTSCALEFAQSWTHELGHVACHIAQTYGLDLDGEEVRYINDTLVEATWEDAKELLCDCCREH